MFSDTKFTIQKLLNTFVVNVPAIQRDYAFGRSGVQNTNKREKFIGNLIDSLINKKSVHLDFIYGLVDGEFFIPLDGQQRITTLWLIDIYMMKNLEMEHDYSYLSNFTYDTRTSTREFCVALLKEEWGLSEVTFDKRQVVEYFFSRKWFFNSWRHDPTITGMLVVLEEIHKCFNQDLLDNISTDIVTFSFLNIDNLGNSEELYVKMNSRGKELSNWDLFKVELFEHIMRFNSDTFKVLEYEKWIDGPFIDFFWSIRIDDSSKSHLTESWMLRFFNFFIYINIFENKDDYDYKNHEDIVNIIEKEWKSIINVEILNEVRNFIEFIVLNESLIKNVSFDRFNIDGLRIDELFGILKKPDASRFLADLDLFYAYKLFIKNKIHNIGTIQLLTDDDLMELKQVIRIVSNFEEPYRKQYTIERNFIDAIKPAIHNEEGILKYFASLDTRKVVFGTNSEEQLEEEIVKSRLLLENTEWEDIIYISESHLLFNGTIGWLLRISNEDVEEMKEVSPQLLNRFNSSGIKDRTEIAKILEYEDIRDYYELLPKNLGDGANNLLRDYSWKKFFRTHGYKRVKENQVDVAWIQNWNNGLEVTGAHMDWKQWIIHFPEILDVIGAIRVNSWGESRIFGVYWRVVRFSSKKYDLPLMAAKQHIDGFTYSGFRAEGESEYAMYKRMKIAFDYDNNEYVILYEENECRVDGSDISSAVEKLSKKLTELQS